jgi:hypothetical protein
VRGDFAIGCMLEPFNSNLFNQQKQSFIKYFIVFRNGICYYAIAFTESSLQRRHAMLVAGVSEDSNPLSVIIMLCECNQQVTNVVSLISSQIWCTQVGTPETICLFATMFYGEVLSDGDVILSEKDRKNRFCQWLAGLIDGDGCFLVSKTGYTSLEITVGSKDEEMLKKIRRVYGGNVKPRGNVSAYRYR